MASMVNSKFQYRSLSPLTFSSLFFHERLTQHGWDALWYDKDKFFFPNDVIDFYYKSQCNEDTDYVWEYYHDKETFQLRWAAIDNAIGIAANLNHSQKKYRVVDMARRVVVEPNVVGGGYCKLTSLYRNQTGVAYWLADNVMSSFNPSHVSGKWLQYLLVP